jgi:hypothetical protein
MNCDSILYVTAVEDSNDRRIRRDTKPDNRIFRAKHCTVGLCVVNLTLQCLRNMRVGSLVALVRISC